MPDRPLTVFTYAASASLAAVALVYFFHPSYLFDGDASPSSANARRKGIIGLHNPANDCFINCVLQSLAGLGDLRVFLIREIHRRELVNPEIYENVPEQDVDGKPLNAQKLGSLQLGLVTKGLKNMIDRLNEKPIHRKTISATPFVRVLELAFGSTISKAQQDAQEFLQLIAERLCEEYHAGLKARKRFADQRGKDEGPAVEDEEKYYSKSQEEGYPLEGQTETRVECEHCHFIPKAIPTSFVILNLIVPQKSSTTLNDCFDAHFKREFIEDYKCDKCRLTHALEMLNNQLKRVKSENEQPDIQTQIEKTEIAIAKDPEKPPEDLHLPDMKLAPKRKISRHVEITTFPRILVVHLSRSIFDPRSYSMKNSGRVTFPERFPIGGILHQRSYKLLGVITHNGTHNSGHYETFRRQHAYPPYSNPHADQDSGPYSSRASSAPTPTPSPDIQANSNAPKGGDVGPTATENGGESGTASSPRTSATHSLPSTQSSTAPEDRNADVEKSAAMQTPKPALQKTPNERNKSAAGRYLSPPSVSHSHSKSASSKSASPRLGRKKKPPADRWWRISDDKIKECKTADVLGMTREVYMLFYEME